MDDDDDIGTLRWFGPTWSAPVNNPRAEISVPLGEHCVRCREPFDHGDQGLGIAAAFEIAENRQVFYHLTCWLNELGVANLLELQLDLQEDDDLHLEPPC